jgi:hypothetical protein
MRIARPSIVKSRHSETEFLYLQQSPQTIGRDGTEKLISCGLFLENLQRRKKP